MALGAGFKLREKEKERASFDKDDSDRSLRPQSRPKEGNRSPDSQHSEVYRAATKNSNYSTTSGLDEFARQSPDPLQITIPQPPPAGWTSVVEDWLCNGGTFELPKAPKTPKIVEVVGNVVTRAVPGTPALALKRTNSIKEPKKGPYQFLAKERLMGIYLAIYVHRDLKPLIKGMRLHPLHLCRDANQLCRYFKVCCHRRVDWWSCRQQGWCWDFCEP